MKIAYTISGLYNSGGMENILTQKANYLAENLGYDVTIITTDQNDRSSFFPLSPKVKLADLGINYFQKKSNKLWHLKKKQLKRKHKKALDNHLKENNYDIVISLMDFDFTFLYKINDSSKKCLEYHFAKYSKANATRNRFKKYIQKFRAKTWDKIVSKYDKFIVLTEEDKNQWGNLNNIIVIPNFIKELPKQQAELKNKRVISIGRADYQKGFDMLINAWKIVNKKFPDWKLTIIGGGDKTSLQHQINQHKLSDSIMLLPPTPNIGKEYMDSSLYVLSSRYEGLPLVLLEAMSYGLPIVSFKCPCGPRDVLKPGFSSILDVNDIEGLSESIMRWMDSYSQRVSAGKLAKQEILNYSIDKIMNKWNQIFIEICADKK